MFLDYCYSFLFICYYGGRILNRCKRKYSVFSYVFVIHVTPINFQHSHEKDNTSIPKNDAPQVGLWELSGKICDEENFKNWLLTSMTFKTSSMLNKQKQ